MSWFLSVVLVILSAVVPVAQAPGETAIEARLPAQAGRAQLNAALEQEWEYELRTHPEMATHIGDPRYNDRLSDYSPEFFAADLKHGQQALQTFESIDTTGFPEQERLNKLLMVRKLRERIEAARFKNWEMPINQMNGVHLGYAELPSVTPFRVVKDYQDYLSRLHQIPQVFQQITANLRAGLRDHLVPPRYLLEKAASRPRILPGSLRKRARSPSPCASFPPAFQRLIRKPCTTLSLPR